jgi:hypothetical protein
VADTTEFLPVMPTRQDYFDFLDGHSIKTGEELYQRRLGRGLIKTYMLETSAGDGGPDLNQLFRHAGLLLTSIDHDGLYLVNDPAQGGPVALLEPLEERHPVMYTLLDSKRSDPWVRRLVQGSPWLDRLWLSAPMFGKLWDYVKASSNPRRYTKLSFEYEARYEVGEVPDQFLQTEETVGSEDVVSSDDDADDVEQFRRTSRFTMVDRVEAVASKLPALQDTYRPLLSTTQLRVPASGRGGHDFYFDGKVTNRADSFLDHRQAVALVLRMYRNATEAAEEALWVSLQDASRPNGSPVFIEFAEELDVALFNRWVESTFERGNRFRLSGKPIRLSPKKVHVYGVDRHLWQPILLELTTDHVMAFLPQGTCGNTVHRLVTNLQRFVDPGVRAWIGDREYASVVASALNVALHS